MTADHAHTSQIVESQPAYALSTVLRTKDGSNMVVSYGTSEDNLYSDGNDTEGTADASKAQGNMSHTGTQLRIAASGPGASRVDGLTDQTDNFYTIAYALGLAADTDAQKALSNDGTVAVKKADDGTYSAELNGFNGDAVISYELKDKASGKVVAASNSDTPVSGVRVATGETTGISSPAASPARPRRSISRQPRAPSTRSPAPVRTASRARIPLRAPWPKARCRSRRLRWARPAPR